MTSSVRKVQWAAGHPQRTNAAGDPPPGAWGKFHAFLLTDGEVHEANVDVVEDVSPLCGNPRWTGAVGPVIDNPGHHWCCKRCLGKVSRLTQEG